MTKSHVKRWSIVKDLEISNDCSELDWECYLDLFKQWLDYNYESGYKFIKIVSCANWQGKEGYKYVTNDIDPFKFFRDLSGGDYEWTLKIEALYSHNFEAQMFCHDCPTGKSVKVLLYKNLRESIKDEWELW